MAVEVPALIVHTPFAAALTQGLPYATGKPPAFKTVELRGVRGKTKYRGAVALFGSAAYHTEDEARIAIVLAWYRRQSIKLLPGDFRDAQIWCRYTSAWRYRLIGFAKLTACGTSAGPDFDGTWLAAMWLEGCQADSFLKFKALHAFDSADTIAFDKACTGCQRTPPHNTQACHAGWQTVNLPDHLVPADVKKEVRPWPKPQSRK